MQFNVVLRTGGLAINREKLRKKRGTTVSESLFYFRSFRFVNELTY